jgi:hypothetical protein
VCQPYFEHMLTAVQLVVQQQLAQSIDQDDHVQNGSRNSESAAFQTVLPQANVMPVHPTFDESSEADELGAFASILSECAEDDEGAFSSLFSGPSEVHSNIVTPENMQKAIDEAELELLVEKAHPIRSIGSERTTDAERQVPPPPAAPQSSSNDDAEQANDSEKSLMVCRHWKSKGWCRLESNCKFQHPEHKRGVLAPKSSSGNTNGGSVSKPSQPGRSTTLNLDTALPMEGIVLPAAASGRKKRSSRDRSARRKQALSSLLADKLDAPFALQANPGTSVPHCIGVMAQACVVQAY